MTHSGGKPHAVGDKGQRYEVRATGWPTAGESVISWTDSKEAADNRAASILKAPNCTASQVIDRQGWVYFECPQCGADLAIEKCKCVTVSKPLIGRRR